MGRSLAAAYTTEKNLDFARPFTSAVFHFGGVVGDVYIDTEGRTIGGNVHTALAKSLGEWRYLIEPRDGSFQLRTMPVELINLPAIGSPLKRFTDLWSGLGIEGIEVDVKQNFRQVGTSTILQEPLFSGVMRPGEYSPDTAKIDLVSVSEKYLDKKEISFPLSRADFPLIAEGEVGKRANVAVGTFKRIKAQPIKAAPGSPLRAAMTDVATTVPIYDEWYDILPANGRIQIGLEQIDYTSKSGASGSRVLGGLTHSANFTTAAAHSAGDAVYHLPTELTYLVSGRKMKSISAVYIKQGDKIVPVKSSRYSVELANSTLKPGQTLALVRFTVPPLTEEIDHEQVSTNTPQTISLPVGGTSASKNVSFGAQQKTKSSGKFRYVIPWSITSRSEALLKGTMAGDAYMETDNTSGQIVNFSPMGLSRAAYSSNVSCILSKTGGVLAAFLETVDLYDSTVTYRVATTLLDLLSGSEAKEAIWRQDADPTYTKVTVPPWTSMSITVSFGAQEKTKSGGKFRYRFKIGGGGQRGSVRIEILGAKNGAGVVYDGTDAPVFGDPGIVNIDKRGSEITWEDATWHNSFTVTYFTKFGSSVVVALVASAMCTVEYNIREPSVEIDPNHLLSQTTADLIVGGEVLVDGEGEPDDASGTYTGTANALIEKPADLLHYLNRALGAVPLARIDTAAFVTARTDSPASYKFSGNLVERSANLKELNLALGQQARLRVDWPVDKLTCRFLKTSYGAISKVLTEDNVMRSGGPRSPTTLRVKHSAIEDVINSINLRYGRDWSKSRSEDAFKKVLADSDAASIAKYGERKQDARFWCDFIAEDNATMAADLLAFFKARYKEPARLISFDCKLDQYELLPGDVIGLNYHSQQQTAVAVGVPIPVGGVLVPVGGVLVGGGGGTPGEIFDGLTGTQKLLVEDVALRPGGSRDNRPTRMSLVLREVA